MTWIMPTRRPVSRIALAGLNTGHPGPMPRGNTSGMLINSYFKPGQIVFLLLGTSLKARSDAYWLSP